MKAVLAYSGGLDTSVLVKILQEKYNFEVITVTVDVGVPEEELKEAEEKAKKLGVLKHYTINAQDEFIRDYVFKGIKANALYEGYPLSTALARPLIAIKVVEVAEKAGAEALVHGATGKGNDQFRFEAIFRSMAPDKKIIAPIREMNLTRKESIEYANKHNIPIPVDIDKPYSIDENLWGRSIEGGLLEDPNYIPPEDIYEWTRVTNPEDEIVEIKFHKGIPVEINGKKMDSKELVKEMNNIAGSHGVGRIEMIEDRILGIKARENYECPGAIAILTAHKALEALVLTRRELKFKEHVEQEWSELIYNGLWTEPLRNDLDAFMDETNKRVSGTVKMKLGNKSMSVVARESPFALYSESAVSFDDKTIDQREVEGILKYHTFQVEMFERVKKDKK